MIVQKGTATLKNGIAAELRSPDKRDAEQMLSYLHQTSEETHFMVRYPEECTTDVSQEILYLETLLTHPRNFMVAAFIDGELVGNCGVNEISDRFKMRHRASLGISIKKKAWGLGIGTLLMEKALKQAKENGFTQVELGVFADNDRARHLYRKLGFTEIGCIPKAFLLKDGTYRDEIQMVKFL
mgnify:CR=1 FL=1